MDRELTRALALLAEHPNVGARTTDAEFPGVRRVQLRVTAYHVYYRVLDEAHLVQVLALWHHRRGSRPPPA